MASRKDLEALNRYAHTKGLRIGAETEKAYLLEDETDPKNHAWIAKAKQTKDAADGELLIREDVFRQKFPGRLVVVDA